jgi:hypothetical protein
MDLLMALVAQAQISTHNDNSARSDAFKAIFNHDGSI